MYRKCQVPVSVLLSQIFNRYWYRFLKNEIMQCITSLQSFLECWSATASGSCAFSNWWTGLLNSWSCLWGQNWTAKTHRLQPFNIHVRPRGQLLWNSTRGLIQEEGVISGQSTNTHMHYNILVLYMAICCCLCSFFRLPWDETWMWKLHLATCAQWLRWCSANSSCSLAFEMGASQTHT